MYNPDKCCQVRKTKSNREHRDECNIANSLHSIQRTTAVEDTDNQ